ncbi:hypothetical protein UY416_18030 [Paenibacillus polymyxa]|uniref:Uncharacterized protein n=1 Tax=Paenibacillus peoriae TaxID=59893 RepID=A0A7H0Y9H7_9BACL|nr:hypothetical protein [Paenibacillus polymyxa]MDY8048191.1 hypothetical protein [Paenibacillus polymyxa]QNR67735.1 hypothetical protein IAQ67_00930 [Paenibacillus peoriae]
MTIVHKKANGRAKEASVMPYLLFRKRKPAAFAQAFSFLWVHEVKSSANRTLFNKEVSLTVTGASIIVGT